MKLAMQQKVATLTKTEITLPPVAKDGEGVDESLLSHHEAEQALLANLIHSNGLYEHISDFLTADHFFDPLHKKIFQAISTLIERNQLADVLTLKDFFARDPELAAAGGPNYLAKLASAYVSLGNTSTYGELIYDAHLRRQLLQLAHRIAEKAQTSTFEVTPIQQIEEAEQFLYELSSSGTFDKGQVPFTDAIGKAINLAERAYKKDSKIVGVTTGFIELDKKMGGLHPSDLLIVAGRPSMGKTAFATNIAFNAAKAKMQKRSEGASCLFFSLEMSAEQLAQRLLASESEVASELIRRGELTEADFKKFTQISRELSTLPLFIDDTGGITMSAIRTRARRLKRKENIGLIVIDYLQLIQSSGSRRQDNRVQELSEITRQLKALAKELDLPIIALSQLSRAVESRDDKKPQLADLRESGSIEQDADVVMFVYREAYYEERKEPSDPNDPKHTEWAARMHEIDHKADIIIAKQRHGPIGTSHLFFDKRFTKFGNLDKGYYRS